MGGSSLYIYVIGCIRRHTHMITVYYKGRVHGITKSEKFKTSGDTGEPGVCFQSEFESEGRGEVFQRDDSQAERRNSVLDFYSIHTFNRLDEAQPVMERIVCFTYSYYLFRW